MYKNILNLIFIIAALGLVGCDKDPCDSAGSANSSECRTDIEILPPEVKNLDLEMNDSYFYDQNSETWQTLKSDEISSGNIIANIPIYSNTLEMDSTTALNSVLDAENHKNNPSMFSDDVYNRVPYVSIKAKKGISYIYRYQRKNSAGSVIYDKTGSIPKSGDLAILPLINSYFDGQLYGDTSKIGDLGNHTLYISAQATGVISKKVQRIDFKTVYNIPSLDFKNEFSDTFKNIKLSTRWDHYYGSDNVTANSELLFASLAQRNPPEGISLDVRVRFENPPKLEIKQNLFFEMPLEYDTFISTGELIASRGYDFYGKTVTVDSSNDFRKTLKIGGESVTENSATEFVKNGLPAGTPLDIEFYFNFQENQKYGQYCTPPSCAVVKTGDPNGKGLLTPLKPICKLIKNESFDYHTEKQAKKSAEDSGSYYSVCHPDTNSSETDFSVLDKTDTYFDFFSYAPFRPSKKWLGHFYGIRDVTYSISGCVQLSVKGAGEPNANFEVKTSGTDPCNKEDGYTYFNIEKTITLFDEQDEIEDSLGLGNLINALKTRTLQAIPFFKFNGDDLSTNDNNGNNSYTPTENRHLY